MGHGRPRPIDAVPDTPPTRTRRLEHLDCQLLLLTQQALRTVYLDVIKRRARAIDRVVYHHRVWLHILCPALHSPLI